MSTEVVRTTAGAEEGGGRVFRSTVDKAGGGVDVSVDLETGGATVM